MTLRFTLVNGCNCPRWNGKGDSSLGEKLRFRSRTCHEARGKDFTYKAIYFRESVVIGTLKHLSWVSEEC